MVWTEGVEVVVVVNYNNNNYEGWKLLPIIEFIDRGYVDQQAGTDTDDARTHAHSHTHTHINTKLTQRKKIYMQRFEHTYKEYMHV